VALQQSVQPKHPGRFSKARPYTSIVRRQANLCLSMYIHISWSKPFNPCFPHDRLNFDSSGFGSIDVSMSV
jgi:hypothetical protein